MSGDNLNQSRLNTSDFEYFIKTTFSELITRPPKLAAETGAFMKRMDNAKIVELNYYFNSDEPATDTKAKLFEMTTKVIQILLSAMTSRFHIFSEYHALPSHTPYSVVMGLFVLMSQLLAIVEDKWHVYLPNTDKPWQMITAASTLDYIVDNNMCISTVPVSSYTTKDINMALDVLGIKWYRLQAHSDLRTYLYGLLHRACIVCATPQVAMFFDTSASRVRQIDACIRLYSMQLIRMIIILDLEKRYTVLDSPTTVLTDSRSFDDIIAHIRVFMHTQATLFMKTADSKTEINTAFDRFTMIYGDVEKFVNIRGMEKASAKIIMMTVRSEIMYHNNNLRDFLVLPAIIDCVKDENPDHFETWSRAESAFSALLRIYSMKMILRKFSIDFFRDFLVMEINIPFFLHEFESRKEPILLQLFGRVHVYFNNKLFKCASVDHAILTWVRIVINDLHGLLENQNRAKINIATTLKNWLSPESTNTNTAGKSDVLNEIILKSLTNTQFITTGEDIVD